MKKISILLVAVISCVSVANAQNTATTIDSLSYALGTNIGISLRTFPAKLDGKTLSKAIMDALEGNSSMSLTESEEFLQNYFTKQQTEGIEKNKETGEAFLNANKSKPGVVVLPSGLQYKIEREGTGAYPKESDEVEAHYRGTLVDGTEFDSSYSRGETITFPLKGVIKGWIEGLQYINEGGKIWLYVPSDLAYGDTKRSAIIDGGSTLIFEIELINIVKNNTSNE